MLQELEVLKLVWARDSSSQMQINDVKNILNSIKSIDKEYLLDWVKKLKLDQIFEKANSDA